MSNETKKTSSTQPVFHVGDEVKFSFGRRKVKGVIVEDRGRIGAGGRQLLRIVVQMEPNEETMIFEMPAEEIEIAK